MIRNKYHGKCSCGAIVEPGKGYVVGRRITCADHADIMRDAETALNRSDGPDYSDRQYGFDE